MNLAIGWFSSHADIKFRSRWLGDFFHSIWLNGVWNQTRKWSAMLIINLICCVTFDIAKSVAADFQWHFSHVATSQRNVIVWNQHQQVNYNSTHSSSCLSEMTRISAIRYLSLSAVVFFGFDHIGQRPNLTKTNYGGKSIFINAEPNVRVTSWPDT